MENKTEQSFKRDNGQEKYDDSGSRRGLGKRSVRGVSVEASRLRHFTPRRWILQPKTYLPQPEQRLLRSEGRISNSF